MDEKINKQVENEPLTKEESRAQFVEITEALGLKHSFNFDEAWEIGLEIRKRKEFENEVIRQLVDNDLYNLGLINSGTAKELAVTLNSANSTNINAKLMSIYDEQISQARKDQLVEEAEADRKLSKTKTGFLPVSFSTFCKYFRISFCPTSVCMSGK